MYYCSANKQISNESKPESTVAFANNRHPSSVLEQINCVNDSMTQLYRWALVLLMNESHLYRESLFSLNEWLNESKTY